MISQRIRFKRKASGEAACKPERMPQEPVLIACVIRAASARQSPQRERERRAHILSLSLRFAQVCCALSLVFHTGDDRPRSVRSVRDSRCFGSLRVDFERSARAHESTLAVVSPSVGTELKKKAKFGGFFLSLSRGEPRLTSSREHHQRVLRDSIDQKLEQKSTEVRPIR